jgi:hypothetical protein
MKKTIYFFGLFFLMVLGFPSSASNQEHYAPNMLIPKKLYDDGSYDVPRMNRVKSNEFFELDIFDRSYFPLATVVHYPPTMYSHEYLLITDPSVHRIIASEQVSNWVGEYGEWGGGEGQFKGPHGISSLGAEYFFVADTYNDRIVYGSIYGDPPYVIWNGTYTGLDFPLDVDARPLTIYNVWPLVVVADSKNHRLMLYEHPNMRACSYTHDQGNSVDFVYPTSLCFGRENGAQNLQLYVTDQGLHKLIRFTFLFDGGGCPELIHWNSYEFPPETYLSAVDVDNKGQVYVVDTREGKVYKFSPLLDLIAVWGGKGVEDGQLLSPTGISIAHGMDCTDYPDPCTPITNLADVFITEYWTDQTGVRRFILSVDILDFSASYMVPVVDDTNRIIGGNYIEYSYYNTDYADVAVKITGPGVMESFHRWDLQPGEHGGTWNVEDNLNGTYTVSISGISIYDVSNAVYDTLEVEVDKSVTTQEPIITAGPCFSPQPPRACEGESYRIQVDAFDPDDEGIDHYNWTTGRSSFSANHLKSITTSTNHVWLDVVDYPGSGRVAPTSNYKPLETTPDFVSVEVVDVDNASSVAGMHFTPENCDPDPPPGCPFLYIWNGEQFINENVILTGSEDEYGDKSLLTDHYVVSQTLKPKDDRYELEIREFENEVSRIDYLSLFAIDYPQDERIGVTPEGKVWIYSNPVSPVSCVDQDGVDHIAEVTAKDNNYFVSKKPGYLIINFGKLINTGLPKPSGQMSDGGGGGIPPPPKQPQKLAPYAGGSNASIVYVDIMNQSGEWKTVAKVYPRTRTVLSLVELHQYVNPNEDFKIKISWERSYSADHIAYYKFDDSQLTVTELRLLGFPLLPCQKTLQNREGSF